MAQQQETDKYLLSRFHSARTGGFSNGKNIKDGTLNGACYHFFLVPKQHVQNPGSGGVVFLLHGYNANSLVRILKLLVMT